MSDVVIRNANDYILPSEVIVLTAVGPTISSASTIPTSRAADTVAATALLAGLDSANAPPLRNPSDPLIVNSVLRVLPADAGANDQA